MQTTWILKYTENVLQDRGCNIDNMLNRIDGVIISLLASSAVYRGNETRSGQAKDY